MFGWDEEKVWVLGAWDESVGPRKRAGQFKWILEFVVVSIVCKAALVKGKPMPASQGDTGVGKENCTLLVDGGPQWVISSGGECQKSTYVPHGMCPAYSGSTVSLVGCLVGCCMARRAVQ